jgi:hypothetical protein
MKDMFRVFGFLQLGGGLAITVLTLELYPLKMDGQHFLPLLLVATGIFLIASGTINFILARRVMRKHASGAVSHES